MGCKKNSVAASRSQRGNKQYFNLGLIQIKPNPAGMVFVIPYQNDMTLKRWLQLLKIKIYSNASNGIQLQNIFWEIKCLITNVHDNVNSVMLSGNT